MLKKVNKRLLCGFSAFTFALAGVGAPAARDAGVRFDIPVFAADIVDRGDCGNPSVNEGKDVYWTLDSEGTLNIRGMGEMREYNWRSSPWYNNDKIKKIVVNAGVENISRNAFRECTSFTSISIPNSVKAIDDYTFYGCTNLSDITISESVKSIGLAAFYECTSLENITIPKSVTSIGRYAFENCKKLQSITIPDKVTSIEDYTFKKCTSLTTVNVPNGLTSIGLYAFQDCWNLKEISIPDSVKSFGMYAFNHCSSLTKINIPDGVKIIESNTFQGCTSLTDVKIPDSVTEIGGYAFENCKSLISIAIPKDVTIINYNAFNNCEKLSSITIPPGVTSFGFDAFIGTSWLDAQRNINPLVIVNNILIDGRTAKDTVIIPNGVKTIGESAFKDSQTITSVVIPDSVTTIEFGAFYYTYGLRSITIPDSVTTIENYAFIGSSLRSITIPNGVTSIGDSTFFSCSGLTSVSIPESVTSIGENAFYYCIELQSVTIPNGVTSIGKSAFATCTSLTRVKIPDSVTSIDTNAFYNCKKLKSIRIPSGVTGIGNRAFGFDENNEKIAGFKIYCTPNSEGERYAKYYGFDYDNGESGDSEYDFPELEKMSFSFLAEDLNSKEINCSDTFYYTDKYFENSSYEYDPSLATASLALAMSSFRAAPIKGEDKFADSTQTKNARAFMKSIGIEETKIYANEYFGKEPEMDSMGVIIGSKPLGDSTLIVVGLRGAGYTHEWGGNFNVGKDGYHTGFAKCRGEVKLSLEKYVEKYKVSGKVKLWIAGYSRAAATANLTAGWLMRNDIKGITLQPEDLYAYCFETPMGAPEIEPVSGASVRDSYFNNIFNIINPNDLVPYVAPSKMGFTRYGRDIIIPTKSNCDPVSYYIAKANMLKNYPVSIKGVYKIDDFCEKTIAVYPLEDNKISIETKKYGMNQDVFLAQFINRVSDEVIGTRQNLSNKYEGILMDFLSSTMPTSKQLNKFGSSISDELSDYAVKNGKILLSSSTVVGTITLLPPIIVSLPLSKLIWDVSPFDAKGAIQRGMIAANMSPLSDKEIDNIADLLLKAAKSLSINDVLTLISNPIFDAHYPELCWAWVKAMDPNSEDHFDYRLAYDKKKTSYSICNINCAVAVNVYDSEGTLVASIIDDEPQDIEIGLCCYIDENGQKTVILPGNGEYRLEVTAREDDTVNIQMLDYDQSAGDYSRNVNYFDIPMKSGEKLNASISAQPADETDREITVKTDKNKIIAADSVLSGEQVSNNQHTVTLIANEDEGTVIGSGTYEYGSFAAIYAAPNEGYTFDGWYDGESKVELDEDGRICVKSDMTLTAKFSSSIIFGDINDDNNVDIDDLLLMQKVVAQWKVNDYNKKAADLNDDGSIDVEDLVLMQKIVAGWKVDLGKEKSAT